MKLNVKHPRFKKNKIKQKEHQFVKLDLEKMLLHEKSFVGAYCNRLYDYGKGMASFHAMAKLKQIAQPKNPMSQT